MKKLFLAVGLMMGIYAFAQKQKSTVTADKTGVTLKFYPVSWNLADTGKQFLLPVGQFVKKMHDKLTVRTPGWKLESFNFTYGARGIYEDSVGNPIMMVDYMTQMCKGDSLPAVVYTYLPTHARAGDTAFFSNIIVNNAAGKRAFGTPFRVVLK